MGLKRMFIRTMRSDDGTGENPVADGGSSPFGLILLVAGFGAAFMLNRLHFAQGDSFVEALVRGLGGITVGLGAGMVLLHLLRKATR